jgi:hypothetical protein
MLDVQIGEFREHFAKKSELVSVLAMSLTLLAGATRVALNVGGTDDSSGNEQKKTV